jgi:hypothetical protein
VVRFGSTAEILNEWGLPINRLLINGSHYKRLAEAFRRVFGSAMFFGTKEQRRVPKSGTAAMSISTCICGREMKVWLTLTKATRFVYPMSSGESCRRYRSRKDSRD